MTQLNIIKPYLDNTKQHTVAAIPTATASITNSPLFKLAAELRLRIYEYAVYSDDNGCCKVTREHGIPEPPLLFTCKFIREEATNSFYSVNYFRMMADSLHPAAVILMARKNRSLELLGMGIRGRRTTVIKDEDISSIGVLAWDRLRLWLEYVHAGECSCLKLRGTSGDMLAVVSMFKIAAELKNKPWGEVQAILDGLYAGLMAVSVLEW
jgi:hypothetical protein